MSIHRLRASEWARSVIADPRAVVLDTETTGFLPHGQICDIAVIAMDGTVLFDALVKPSIGIPAGATAVHGIHDHHVTDADEWYAIADTVHELLHGRRIVAYKVAFDRPIVENAFLRCRRAPFLAQWECAMLQFKAFAGFPKRYNLDLAAATFGILPGGHRARQDAEVTRRVVYGMADMTSLLRAIPTGGES